MLSNIIKGSIIGIVLVVFQVCSSYGGESIAIDYWSLSNPGITNVQKNDCTSNNNVDLKNCTLINDYLNPAIKLLGAVAGIAAVIGLIVGGMQMSGSNGDPQVFAKGKQKIINSIIGFVSFLFLASFVSFMSPGGLRETPGSVPNPSAAVCSAGNGFLGLKPWYSYLPADRFDQDGQTCAVTGFEALPANKSRMSDIVPVALVVVDDLLRIAGLVAVVFVLIGGIKYMTSQGEPGETAKAKDTIINALIGLVIAIIATGVISYLGHQLANP